MPCSLGVIGYSSAMRHEFDVRKREFVAAGGAFVGADGAGDDERRLLRHAVDGFEDLLADVGQRRDALHDAGAVADDDETDLARGAFVIQPALDRDCTAIVSADVFNIDVGRGG